MPSSFVALDSSSSTDEYSVSTVSNSRSTVSSGYIKHRIQNSNDDKSVSTGTYSSSVYSSDDDSDAEYFSTGTKKPRRKSVRPIRINKDCFCQALICVLLFAIASNSYRKRNNEQKNTSNHTEKLTLPKKVKSGNHTPQRIFMCGLFEGAKDYTTFGMQMMRSILPELDAFSDTNTPLVSIEDISHENPGENDILVYYLHADCFLDADDFPGWTVFFSGEFPHLMPQGKRVLYLGPNDSGPHSIRTTFLQMYFFKLPYDKKQLIMNHTMKEKNNKKYFLLYAASNCIDFREKALDMISEIDVVHQGGKCWGAAQNRERVIEAPEKIDRMEGANGNAKMFANYRFALVMENTFAEGYISEKLLNAFMGGTIPIWYGTKGVFNIFNKDAFIYFDIDSPDEAIDKIKYLEKNPEEYQKMLDAPILAGNANETISQYFSYSDEIGGGFLKEEIRSKLGF